MTSVQTLFWKFSKSSPHESHSGKYGEDHIKSVFQSCQEQKDNVFFPYVMVGYPDGKKETTVAILLALERGGANGIELGFPYSDPVADGPTIVVAGTTALENGVSTQLCFDVLHDARAAGLSIPVFVMCYYNIVIQYGHHGSLDERAERFVQIAKRCGADGFIIPDLPNDEALKSHFFACCLLNGLALIPLVSPSTPGSEVRRILSREGLGWVYCVSYEGTTGKDIEKEQEREVRTLEEFVQSVMKQSPVPVGVGFGIKNSTDFHRVVSVSDVGIIGSELVRKIKTSYDQNHGNTTLISQDLESWTKSIKLDLSHSEWCDLFNKTKEDISVMENTVSKRIKVDLRKSWVQFRSIEINAQILAEQLPQGSNSERENLKVLRESLHQLQNQAGTEPHPPSIADYEGKEIDDKGSMFGKYGGRFVAEGLMPHLKRLHQAHIHYFNDSEFRAELQHLLTTFVGRPTELTFADKLTEACGGAKIYLKREDLAHMGSHKLNNVMGQALLAKKMGKNKVVAETGAGQHGVATATACAKLGLEAVIFMGEKDCARQELNVFRMKLLGAKVVPVTSGSRTLKDAVIESMKFWLTNARDTYFLVGSCVGPDPYPTIVRDFQQVIGEETREQILQIEGRLPDAVVACVGGGSNAIGIFSGFIDKEGEENVELIGVEAAGLGLHSEHGATICKGTTGVLHGAWTLMLQTDDGQVRESYSLSAGLDYPGVGPQHAYLNESGRAKYVSVTDVEAVQALGYLSKIEGIIPALESAHAVHYGIELAKEMSKDKILVINVSGRGDKDMPQISQYMNDNDM